MEDNLQEAWEILEDPNTHVLLTGPAGSGKSTLIKKFIAAHKGETIVLAPTGIAAVGIGGVTVHKFFSFPARPIGYNSVKKLDKFNPQDYARMKVLEAARYIIIDEISMVRADLMDQIGWFLHKNFTSGLNGFKFIMVGDLDQLPPVVASEEENEMLQHRYKSKFFFHAKMWTDYSSFTTFRLTKIFRQSDPYFIGLLNDIKYGRLTQAQIDELNSKCLTTERVTPEDGILICGTNKVAGEVNRYMLETLEASPINLVGTVTGEFNEKNCPVDKEIILKIGAKVMTMRNDPEGQYQNGSIGTLIRYDQELDYLVIEMENGRTVSVTRYSFESVEFKFDQKENKISSTITGQFIQFPIRLAYAITIHKSQGKTFDKVLIDLGSGAFEHGQTYVALSRATSIEGVKLLKPLKASDLIYDKCIEEFNRI